MKKMIPCLGIYDDYQNQKYFFPKMSLNQPYTEVETTYVTRNISFGNIYINLI